MKESMEQLGKRVGTLITKSDNNMVSAAVCAKEAHDRYMAGEKDGFDTWKEWWEARTGLSRRRGDQLIQIGSAKDPEKALEEYRAKHATDSKVSREARASVYQPPIDPKVLEKEVQDVKDFMEGPVAWLNRAKSVVQIAVYAPIETCPQTQKMSKAVDEVIETWTKIREHIRKGK